MVLSEFTQPERGGPLLAAAAGWRPGTRARLLCAGSAAVLLLAGAVLVYATGGTRQAWIHIMYVPVLLAGWAFGRWGGLAAGVAAGLLVGPLMPLDVVAGEAQPMANWLYRLGFFTVVGGLAGGLNDVLRVRLRAAEGTGRRFAALVHHAPDLIIVCDAAGGLRYTSPAVTAVLGHAAAALTGRRLGDLVHPDDRALLARLVDRQAATQRALGAGTELRVAHEDGSWRHLEVTVSDLLADPDVGAVVVNGHDVTQRRAMEAELQHQAGHDAATGLANRQRFTDELQLALQQHTPAGRPAVMLINLDRFKAVNESYGPETGDQLIAALAHRLAARTRPQDVLARYSGNEFALLCPDLDDPATAAGVAERLLDSVREPFLLITGEVRLQASIGVALATDRPDPSQLVSDAYTALRHAKRDGGNRALLFHPDWRTQARTALRTEHALHGVLDRGELALHYQPVVTLDSARPIKFEALLRWQHPQLGLVAPSDFIPIAEQTGSIIPIGRWVLTHACAQLATWRQQSAGAHLGVAVNLSPVQLDDAALLDHVHDAVQSAGIPPSALTLELTESAWLHDPDRAREALVALKHLGVRLAVDDFGTGYSSLGHLHHLPVDVLKIDRLFIRQLGTLDADETIVSAVIGLGHSLGLLTIAEGVETPEQARSLTRLGCQHAQGYLYGRPQPADQVTPILASHDARA